VTALLVALGAAVGAPTRYLVDRTIVSRFHPTLPWGTLLVNVVASVVLGFVTGGVVAGHVDGDVQALLGTGLCGALSTYSTFSFEVLRLAETGERARSVGYVVASVAGAVGAAFLGAFVATALWK